MLPRHGARPTVTTGSAVPTGSAVTIGSASRCVSSRRSRSAERHAGVAHQSPTGRDSRRLSGRAHLGTVRTPKRCATWCARSATRCAPMPPAINRLNVYPVPDGDTGTNMARTLDAVVAELDGVDADDLAADVQGHQPRLADGRARQQRRDPQPDPARLRRHAEGAGRGRSTDARAAFAEALQAASTGAYQAVLKPIEGTILTVVREAAERGQGGRRRGRSLVEVLARRPRRRQAGTRPHARLLPVLEDAGVVDAGGAGFLLLLDAALHVVDGGRCPSPTSATVPIAEQLRGDRASPRGSDGDARRQRAALRGDVLPRPRRRADRRRSRTAGARSATRSSSSAATASGTATSTPTTSAPRSRPRSTRRAAAHDPGHRPVRGGRRGARRARGRDGGAAGADRPGRAPARSAAGHHGGRRGVQRRRPRRAVRPARRAGHRHRRPDDEPVDRRAARRRRARQRRPGRDPAEQQEHHPGRRAGRRADRRRRCGSCRPRSMPEALAALVVYDPEADGRRQRRRR